MKKFLLFPLLCILFLTACKKEEDSSGIGGYPTDGLTLNPETKSLFLIGYAKGQATTAALAGMGEVLSFNNKNSLNTLSLVSGEGGVMYSPLADSLYDNFSALSPASFLLNGEPVTDFMLVDEIIKDAKETRPAMSVSHKVSRYDSAWVVDVKLRVFKDTASSQFFVETYMLADVPAKNYTAEGIDLRMAGSEGLIANTETGSSWDMSFPSLDSSTQVITKGEAYIHKYILLSGFNKERAFGTSISSEYNPFDYLYSSGDIIGTQYTPIRHYFSRDSDLLPGYPLSPRFLTVIWYKDTFTGSYIYVNSYADGKTY